jgi:hypothetical protein
MLTIPVAEAIISAFLIRFHLRSSRRSLFVIRRSENQDTIIANTFVSQKRL